MRPTYREWVDAFIARNRDRPLWTGFLRFCEAYHADGLRHLIGNAEVSVGALRAEEAEAVAWLVRWHFIHQAHSRSLLSRSRILDKNFLCRSLHPAAASEKTVTLSRLIERLAEYETHRGWAFHLCCNAMAMGLWVSEDTHHHLDALVANMCRPDAGLTLGALTYETAMGWPRLRNYFGVKAHRDFALDILGNGIELDQVLVCAPRFTFVRHPAMLERDFLMQWPRLWQHSIQTIDVPALGAKLRAAAERLVTAKKVAADGANRVIEAVCRGDLRDIEAAVVARDPVADVFEHIVLAAVELRARDQGRLF